MHIAFITSNYPSPSRPSAGPFVQKFVWAMARQGHACTVVHPISVFERKYGPYPSRVATEDAGGGHLVHVHRPRYVSFSWRDLGWIHTGRWSNAAFGRASGATIRRLARAPELVYGHFMYPAGAAAVRAARALDVPSVVGVGEGEFWTLVPAGDHQARRELAAATGVLAVSSPIADELKTRLQLPVEKIRIFPNGVELDAFRPYDRAATCAELGLPRDTFNIGYLGPFVPQKGYPQLREAVAGLADVRLVLLGRGEKPAPDPQIAFCGAVGHADVPRYLGACDIFVLPTRIEGSCNSVIEAMACGLPIVTSAGRFMDDIVDDSVALRVDPTDGSALRAAILALKNDPGLRTRMSAACLRKSREFDINERARRVCAWMEELRRKP